MKKINEFINNNKTKLVIDDKLLHYASNIIFGMDDEDPWHYDYDYLKLICEKSGHINHYEYIKNKMEFVMKRIIDDKLDYDLGIDLKYKYVEEEFGQKVIRTNQR